MNEAQRQAALAQLVALRENYRLRCKEVIAALQERVEHSDGWDAGLQREIEREMHKLAGSGGTFGFVELGRLAHSLELQLSSLPGPVSSERGQIAARIRDLLPTLEGPSPEIAQPPNFNTR